MAQDEKPIPFLFSSERSQHTDDEFKELDNKYKFETKITCMYPVIVEYNGAKQIITTYFKERYPDIDIESLFYTSRIAKQKQFFLFHRLFLIHMYLQTYKLERFPTKILMLIILALWFIKKKWVLRIYLLILKLKGFTFGMSNP